MVPDGAPGESGVLRGGRLRAWEPATPDPSSLRATAMILPPGLGRSVEEPAASGRPPRSTAQPLPAQNRGCFSACVLSYRKGTTAGAVADEKQVYRLPPPCRPASGAATGTCKQPHP